MTMTPEQVFFYVYKGQQNFMTPRRVQPLLVKDGYVYEISSGEGMRGKLIYGVTVINMDGQRMPKLNGLFDTLADAHEYVADGFKRGVIK